MDEETRTPKRQFEQTNQMYQNVDWLIKTVNKFCHQQRIEGEVWRESEIIRWFLWPTVIFFTSVIIGHIYNKKAALSQGTLGTWAMLRAILFFINSFIHFSSQNTGGNLKQHDRYTYWKCFIGQRDQWQ